jgi:GNAT superfamily N-acetyltransferase
LPTPELRVERVDASVLHGLRRRILRGDDPAKYAPDARDEEVTSLHFGGFLGDTLVVSASFFPSSSPTRGDLECYQLRYMATAFEQQGRGYGAEVLAKAEGVLRERGAEQVWANARDTALGFYRATGWTLIEGSEHLSPETQLPHTVIVKALVDPGD